MNSALNWVEVGEEASLASQALAGSEKMEKQMHCSELELIGAGGHESALVRTQTVSGRNALESFDILK